MAAKDAESLALEALSRAAADPSPRPLHGTSARPGIFTGSSQVAKAASALCAARGWVEKTGETTGSGKARRDLYRLTPAGLQHVARHGEPNSLLRDLVSSSQRQEEALKRLAEDLARVGDAARATKSVVQSLSERLEAPELGRGSPVAPPTGGAGESTPHPSPVGDRIVSFLQARAGRASSPRCPLPELFVTVAQPLGLSIGGFHDVLRALLAEGRIQLHPWTQAPHQLRDEEYALVLGRQIQYYAASNPR